MKLLVVYSSRHQSTAEIASFIAEVLRGKGFEVTVESADTAASPAAFEGLILGSAVYAGSWRKPALGYLETHQEVIRTLPTWLFSSGPVGEDPQPQNNEEQVLDLLQKTSARSHTTFVGKLDRDELNLAEKLIIRMVKAPYGDYRDWESIQTWAEAVANELEQA